MTPYQRGYIDAAHTAEQLAEALPDDPEEPC